MDLAADVSADVVLRPGERRLVPTGLAVAIPAGYEGQVRPRSGLAHRDGLTLLNAPGTIDADYRGEVQVLLINLGRAPVRSLRAAAAGISPRSASTSVRASSISSQRARRASSDQMRPISARV